MISRSSKLPKKPASKLTREDMERLANQARKARKERMEGYREQSLRIHPWVCARCGREFTQKNLHQLTVHHKDHNHDNNPPDGSNWENLCVYCHDNEHGRYLDETSDEDGTMIEEPADSITHKPFAALADMLNKKK
ncbi:MAG TPA: HNH nuclease family protein [Deltaproteobacteria bacterium]|nr:HNH nuclease family protein [Deltaproteobacteria bacterium]